MHPSDNLIVVGRSEEALSHLEVHGRSCGRRAPPRTNSAGLDGVCDGVCVHFGGAWWRHKVWNEAEDSFFVHHDLLLDSFPLCVEWVGFDPSSENEQRGNLVAVGTMAKEVRLALPKQNAAVYQRRTPPPRPPPPNTCRSCAQIDLWDLDVVDAPEPVYRLGGMEKTSSGKKKVAVSSAHRCMFTSSSADMPVLLLLPSPAQRHGHKAEVLGLAWNRGQPNLLASSSADTTVRLWDLAEGKGLRVYANHSKPVRDPRCPPPSSPIAPTARLRAR